MAEAVGFEPTCPCGQRFRVKLVTTTSIRFRIEYLIYAILSHDFESAPL